MNSFCPECRRTYDRGVGVCPHDDTELRPTEERDDPLLGTVFEERYRLDEMLGSGGMGVVYRANQLAVDRDVAVKILRSEVSQSEEAHQRFSREAKLISSLSHPNIVQLIDFGRDPDEGAWFLVMEYVGGRELGDLLDDGPLDVEVALEVVYQTCAALSASHASGMIHRDLKPENLHLQTVPDGTLQVKVLDFGIARCVEKTTRLTESDMICGTPGYMAPEQARGFDVDPRADIYSLGVILYEMLTGTRPFEADEAIQLLVKHLSEEPEPLEEYLPSDVPVDWLQGLVSEMMAKSPEDRPDDAATVRSRIEEIREAMGQPLHQLPGHYGSDRGLDDLVRPVDRDSTEKEFSYAPEADRDPIATTAGTFQALDPDTDDFGNKTTAQLASGGTEEEWPAGDRREPYPGPTGETLARPEAARAPARDGAGTADDYPPRGSNTPRGRDDSAPASRPPSDEGESRRDTSPSTDSSDEPTAPSSSGGDDETLLRTALTLVLGSAMLAVAVAWLQHSAGPDRSEVRAANPTPDASTATVPGAAVAHPDDATVSGPSSDTTPTGETSGGDEGRPEVVERDEPTSPAEANPTRRGSDAADAERSPDETPREQRTDPDRRETARSGAAPPDDNASDERGGEGGTREPSGRGGSRTQESSRGQGERASESDTSSKRRGATTPPEQEPQADATEGVQRGGNAPEERGAESEDESSLEEMLQSGELRQEN